MTQKFKLFGFSFLFIVLMGGCSAKFYTANRNPMPLFQKSGDVYVDASTNLFNKVDLTAGMAISGNVGVYAGYAGAVEKYTYSSANRPSERFTYNGNMLNLGLGYFINLRKSQRFRFEVYGDLGLGNFVNKVNTGDNRFFNGNYQRIGIMPNIGYNSDDNRFNMGYSLRASSISFSNAKIQDSIFWKTDIERYNKRDNYSMIEHAILFRYGSKNIKFQLQIAAYHVLDVADLDHAIDPLKASFMFGIVLTPNITSL